MKRIATLVAAATLGLFCADAFGQSATCVNELNALITASDQKVAALVADSKYHNCVNPATGLYFDGKSPNYANTPQSLDACLKEIEAEVQQLPSIHNLHVQLVAKGSQCLAVAKKEASDYVAAHANCRVKPDSSSTIQCKSVASYDICQKAKPWSPGHCGLWNGQVLATCCNISAY